MLHFHFKWVFFTAYLGDIKRVPFVFLCLFRGHDLDLERPGRVLPVLDVVVKVPDGVIWVISRQTLGVSRRQVLDTLVRL